MSLFRCEEMRLFQLFLQSEAAYNCVGEMGELGLVQFRDMNPEANAFQRKFVNEVRRCDEMERKLRFIGKEVKKEAHVKVSETVPEPKEVPHPREMNEMETQLEKLEHELRELLTNQEQLQKNFQELTELKQVLLRTQGFFQEGGAQFQGTPGDEIVPSDDPGATKLGVVAGVIGRERLGAFERVLWRVCRGNVYMKQTDIDEPMVDPTTGESVLKSVFIVFYQGEQLGSRVKKICEGFRATLYPCPEQASERREMLMGVESRISDLESVIRQTLDHRSVVLDSAAANITQWMVKVKKMKAIYHTLNLFQVSQKYLQVQCWIPLVDQPRIQAALDRGTTAAGSSVPSVLSVMTTQEQPPTFNRCNKFTRGFQNIIDAYGVATYREMNPMPFTVISFPFLFAVMFGDAGHGLIMALFAGLLIWREQDVINAKSKSEIFLMFFGGRYVILLMGVFSVYTGTLYNDMFSKSINIFGSQWQIDNETLAELNHISTAELDPRTTFDGNSPYPFGFDPMWQVAENKLLFLNSFKMKVSVILGVMHMMFGVWLSLLNHTYFKKKLNVVGEFLPQFLFLGSLFGYLCFMIIYKWFAFSATNSQFAPNLLTTMIDMFMKIGSSPANELYSGQAVVQTILVLIAVICVPWMLLMKPIVLYLRHRNPGAGLSFRNLADTMGTSDTDGATRLLDHDELTNEQEAPLEISSEPGALNGATNMHPNDGSAGEGHSDDENFEFGEVMILQAIHTIEFCLNCISHTASYLRLWALSLAHAELSEVLWEMVLHLALGMKGAMGVVAILILFPFWALLTCAILLLMEGLSAFLHALRLHWVEFQSKFYHGDGHLFAPFTFQHIIDNPFEE